MRALQGVKGVSQIERIGGVEREIRIALDPDRLLAFGITAGDVNRQLRATNVDLAGGRGEIGGREQAIRTLAGKQTVEDLAATMITLPRGRKVRLDQLGTVTRRHRRAAHVRGARRQAPVVAFAISRAKGASDTVVAADVAKKVEELQKAHPDVEIKLIDSMVTYTLGAYHSTMKTMIEGAILAIIVVFIFLRDWRATLIAAIALPLSIIPAFWALDVAGFSLNLVSLLAITIVTGILVDDAIVEIENIVRHMRMGKIALSRGAGGRRRDRPRRHRHHLDHHRRVRAGELHGRHRRAVLQAVRPGGGLRGVLLAAGGAAHHAAAGRLFHAHDPSQRQGELACCKAYTRLVRWSVAHHYKAVALGLLIFAASIGSFYLLPSGFLPAEDQSRTLLAVELPPGSRMDDTRARHRRHRRARSARGRRCKSVFINGGRVMGVGRGGAQGDAHHQPGAQGRAASLSQAKVNDEIGRGLAGVPDIRFWFLQDNGQRQFQLVVSGRDGRRRHATPRPS